jgi:hypothetical protein
MLFSFLPDFLSFTKMTSSLYGGAFVVLPDTVAFLNPFSVDFWLNHL